MTGLPPNGTTWPPRELREVTEHLRGWDAWYTGSVEKLAEHYYGGYFGAGVPGYPVPHAAQYRGGMVGTIARWFWGQPIAAGQQLNKVHVPIASDICTASADLLFAEPPTLTVDTDGGANTATQDRLNVLADDTLHSVLAEAVEIGAALGGSYLLAAWDRDVVPDRPFLRTMHADAAWPEFSYGRLRAVTFWSVVKRDGQQVWRHLERHSLDTSGVGVIEHALYQGSEQDLGKTVPLTDVDATAPLARLVNADRIISTGSPGLDVVYVPNRRPQRRWRNHPVGHNLGRSDLDGVEHLMDALDETYTSWMRDIRLGKGRVFVSKDLLDDIGAGQGAMWDADREVYAPLKTAPGSLNPNGTSGTSTSSLAAQQFAIRYEEHSSTAQNLVETILRTAGYSSQTFGMDDSGGRQSNLTATEVQARERRSYLSRDRKIRLVGPEVSRIMTKLLWIDKTIFGTAGVDPEQAVSVGFADSTQESAITLAQTAQALSAARAASTQTLVQLVHPDWDDDQVQSEVDRIKAEEPAAPDPTQVHLLPGFSGDIPTEG
ncbi:MAG TPA: phage portal protein [Jatrophihabitantaceae bacterium]|nr:phage portal protein [Jatrophihabitantaceae bacterium]